MTLNLSKYSRTRDIREPARPIEAPTLRPRYTPAQKKAFAQERVSRKELAARLGVVPETITHWRQQFNCVYLNTEGRQRATLKARREAGGRFAVQNGWSADLGLSPNETRILTAVRRFGTLTSRGLCVVFGWDNRTARAYICRLRKKGLLEKADDRRHDCHYRVPHKMASGS